MSLNNEELENLSPKERVPPLPYTPNDAQQEANTANAIAMQGPILVPLPAAGTGAYIVQPTPYVLPMVIGNQMGPKPASITCPSCKEVIVTTIKTRPNTGTHMCAMMFCFMWLVGTSHVSTVLYDCTSHHLLSLFPTILGLASSQTDFC